MKRLELRAGADLARVKAELEPPWDDLREQRVLARVLEQRRAVPGQARRARVAALVAAVAAILVAGLGIVLLRMQGAAHGAAIATVPALPSTSTIALADGSRVVLQADADVAVEEQGPDRVRIAQSRGAVRYEVRPDRGRDFAVRAGGVTVRVRGTVFGVDLEGDTVEVQVERGRVEVDDGTRTRELGAGETLRAPAWPSESAEAGPGAHAGDPLASPASAMSEAPVAASGAVPSAASLQATADAARLAGRNAEAAASLEKLVALHPADARVPSALFTLGRIERARGRSAASAQSFDRCLAAAPGGPLAQDALTEAALAWSAAGASDAARSDANRYLARWPNGASAGRMRALVGQ